MAETCFQFKGSVVTTFILEIYQYSLQDFTQQLQDKINQAPEFFAQSPIVISLDKVDEKIAQLDLSDIISTCRQFGLQPMAFKCTDPRFLNSIQATGLTLLSDNASRSITKEPATEQEYVSEVKEKIISRQSKIITKPVRSGQQVYAKEADLIIISQVSEGAEVLADGHIHIYGALRGRALAGIKGDTSARVFCNRLEAELISIAGNFMLSDVLREKIWQQSAQVYLNDKILHVEAV